MKINICESDLNVNHFLNFIVSHHPQPFSQSVEERKRIGFRITIEYWKANLLWRIPNTNNSFQNTDPMMLQKKPKEVKLSLQPFKFIKLYMSTLILITQESNVNFCKLTSSHTQQWCLIILQMRLISLENLRAKSGSSIVILSVILFDTDTDIHYATLQNISTWKIYII